MQRVICSTLSLPLKRRLIGRNQCEKLFQQSCLLSKNNVKFISSTNKIFDVEKILQNESQDEEKILISNIEGRTKKEIQEEGTKSPVKKAIKRVIPSKHSRKLPPSIASAEIVDDMTNELLSSPIGSLYTYDSDFKGSEDQGFIVSDVWSQKVEFLLRGHSSLIDGSIVRYELQHESLELPDVKVNDDKNIGERIRVMQSLLERMENEAEAYKEAYITAHSAMEEVKEPSSSQKKGKKGAEDVSSSSKGIFKGAPPGPTISMYDIVLDAYAISTHLPTTTALTQAQSLFNKATHRHIQNGGPDNTQRHTIPTSLTFNAVIRTASNTSYDYTLKEIDERTRDEVLNAAFWTFDKMYHTDCTERNTATYIYMLRMLKKCMPESRVRGNIAHALFDLAVEDKVMDDCIYEELKVNGGGELYENWLRFMDEKDGDDPIEDKWRINAVKRRYHSDSNLY